MTDDQRTLHIPDDGACPAPDGPSESGRSGEPSTALSILLVDDNPHVAESLAMAVRLAGHFLDHAAGPEEALSQLAARRYDAILLDLNYAAGRTDGAEGMALLARILAEDQAARIVVVTAHSGIRIAVEAMRAGACDFVMKPWRNADLLSKLTAAAAHRVPRSTATPAQMTEEPVRLIGDSQAMASVRDLIRRVGPTRAGVLVTGLSGSGRSLVATALHAASGGGKLTRLDLRDREGWTRIDAATGTLLLRYPDQLGAVEQARLLDRLPDAVRLIAIADWAGAIGPALARRLAAIEIALPPLSEREGDVLLLLRHFLRLAAIRHARAAPRLTPAAEEAVRRAAWPDQLHGLAAAAERAVLLGEGDVVDAALLVPPPLAPSVPAAPVASRFDLEESERAMIEAALREHHHNVTHAATALGLSRGALYRRMERHGL